MGHINYNVSCDQKHVKDNIWEYLSLVKGTLYKRYWFGPKNHYPIYRRPRGVPKFTKQTVTLGGEQVLLDIELDLEEPGPNEIL